MIFRLVFCVLFFASLQPNIHAQEGGGPQKKDQSIKSKRKLRKADRKKWKEDRAAERAEKKKIKAHHKRIQTKELRKRMKRSKVKAQRNHDHQRAPFFLRMFTKKGKHKSTKQPKERKSKSQN